ncbi:hypothetical protein FACS189449_09710 [Alphaproteobacteria bacterium]|nr:hypothetical protein FACS189449_09710 [Alphaproteobacteria bacterium]
MKNLYILVICLVILGCESNDRHVNDELHPDRRNKAAPTFVQLESNPTQSTNKRVSIILPDNPYPNMTAAEAEKAKAQAQEEDGQYVRVRFTKPSPSWCLPPPSHLEKTLYGPCREKWRPPL